MDPNNPITPEEPKLEPQAPVTPVDPPAQSAQPTEPVQPSTPQPDIAKLEGSVTEKVSKVLLEKIGSALGLTKEEKKTLPTDPEELAKFVQENAKKGTEEVLSERERADREQAEARERQISEGSQRYQGLWKTQYEQLAASGKVPKIVNPTDKNDPGNLAKVKILTKLAAILKENEANGVDYVPTLKEIYYEFPDVLTTATTTGATVPISGGGRSMTPNDGLSYSQIHSTDVEDLVRNKYN